METVLLRAKLWCELNPGKAVVMVSEEMDHASPERVQIVTDLDEWVAAYVSPRKRPTDRRAHEVYHEDLPCRAFFDLESNDVSVDMDAAVHQLVEWVTKEFGATTHVDLDSTRAEKLSRHVVFPTVVFPEMRQLRAVLPRLRAACPLAASVMDMNVYARRAGTLRVAFSTGFGKTTWLVPRESAFTPSKPPTAACERVLRDSLVAHVGADDVRAALQRWTPSVELPPLPARNLSASASANASATDWMGWDASELQRLTASVSRAVRRMRGSSISSVRSAPNEIRVAARGLVCAAKRRAHRSNRVAVVVVLPPRAFAREFGPINVHLECMDEACASTGAQWTDERVELAVAAAFFHCIRC